MWVFALFLAVPLIEIALFVTVGGWLTLWPVLAIVIGTGMLGVFLLRLQGLRARENMQSALKNIRNPVSDAAHGGLIMVAAILLILPGFLTDTVGLLLLMPPVRQGIIRHFASRMGVFSSDHTDRRTGRDWRDGGRPATDDDVIDAEYREIDPERSALRDGSRWRQD